MERLQKYISESGLTSRRKAEELIKQGKVMVDGKVVTLLGTKVSGKEEIIVDNVLLKKDDKVYYLLNKPRGVVTTVKDDKERKTVVDLIETKKRIYPIGRLDYDTTGVLLLTNDGSFANMLMHPKSNIEKVYVAKLNGILSKDSINTLLKGVKIDNYIITTKDEVYDIINYNYINLSTINEYLKKATKNDNQYLVYLKDIILGNDSDDYIVIDINENNIFIDYTVLMKEFNNNLNKYQVIIEIKEKE